MEALNPTRNTHPLDFGVAMVTPLPCPFCGSDVMVMTWETNDDPRLPGWRCGCLEPDCDINPFTKTRWYTKQDAVESWNRRATLQ